MAGNAGLRVQRKLNDRLPEMGNSIRIKTVTVGTDCPGAIDPLSGEYDPKRDRAYHLANPGAPVCNEIGKVGASETIKTIKALHFENLKDAEAHLKMSLGEVKGHATVLIYSQNQHDAKIREYEFPLNSEQWWSLAEGFPRSVFLNDLATFYIAVGTKGPAP